MKLILLFALLQIQAFAKPDPAAELKKVKTEVIETTILGCMDSMLEPNIQGYNNAAVRAGKPVPSRQEALQAFQRQGTLDKFKQMCFCVMGEHLNEVYAAKDTATVHKLTKDFSTKIESKEYREKYKTKSQECAKKHFPGKS